MIFFWCSVLWVNCYLMTKYIWDDAKLDYLCFMKPFYEKRFSVILKTSNLSLFLMRKWKISDHSSLGVDSNHVIQTPCCPSYTENTAFTLEDPLSPYFFHCRVNILTKIPENFSCVKKTELLSITWSSEATSGVPPSQLFPPINVALFTTQLYHTNHPTNQPPNCHR